MRHMNDQLGVKKARQNEIGGMVEAYEWAVGFEELEAQGEARSERVGTRAETDRERAADGIHNSI